MYANTHHALPRMQPAAAGSRKFGNDLTGNQNYVSHHGGKAAVKSQPAVLPQSRAAVQDVVRVENIDARDRGNPQCVTDYAQQIHQWFRQAEEMFMPPKNYMETQKNINVKMRAILIDWLVEVHLKFKLMPETLYLTVNLIDRYLARRPCPRRKLQLVGVTCMLLASKYEEIYFPEVRDFVYITDKAYSREEILAMEGVVLNALKFDLTVATPLVFLKRFLKAAKADDKVSNMAHFFTERMLQEYSMLGFTASNIAASAVSMALRVHRRPAWTPTLQHYASYTESDLKLCMGKMSRIVLQQQNLQAVSKKYSSQRLGKASMVPLAPALFALSSEQF